MKHDASWRNRTQFLTNKLRESVIPSKNVGRFVTMMCTCNPSVDQQPGSVMMFNISLAPDSMLSLYEKTRFVIMSLFYKDVIVTIL